MSGQVGGESSPLVQVVHRQTWVVDDRSAMGPHAEEAKVGRRGRRAPEPEELLNHQAPQLPGIPPLLRWKGWLWHLDVL